MITKEPLISTQKDKFTLPENVHYLNCATRSPLSKKAEQAGYEAVRRDTNPFGLHPDDFFRGAMHVRSLFSELICNQTAGGAVCHNVEAERIAIIPSVSYGMAVVARNLSGKPGLRAGQKIVLVGDEFPSDVYAWDRVCTELGLSIVTVPMPDTYSRKVPAGTNVCWTPLAPIRRWWWHHPFTGCTVSASIWKRLAGGRGKWARGWPSTARRPSVRFTIRPGMLIQPDAVICAGYKWLMGPYSLGLAYFGPAFDDGIPLEEGWMNRLDSNQFHRLMDYQPAYRPKAYRYNVGEHSHFMQMPMLEAALTQLIEWQPDRIQDYTKALDGRGLAHSGKFRL